MLNRQLKDKKKTGSDDSLEASSTASKFLTVFNMSMLTFQIDTVM